MSVAPPFAVDVRREVPGGQPARRVMEAIFPNAEVAYVEGWASIADVFDRLEDQRPATCGAYATRICWRRWDIASDGVDTTREDFLAYLAGTVIEQEELEEVERTTAAVAKAGLSDGEAIEHFPRTWYGWPLRVSDDDAITGTSPTGTARAIAIGSGGELVTVPVPARDRDGAVLLDPDRFDALLDLIESQLGSWRIHPIANLEVDQLLDATSDAYAPDTLSGTRSGVDDPAGALGSRALRRDRRHLAGGGRSPLGAAARHL